MQVILVSQCEKKAIARTRRVLDAFANRIGDNTWQTIITEDGLMALKHLLRQTATRNTAVACHWIRSRQRSELMWIVGNRNKFNHLGIVPVNSTRKMMSTQYENDWYYLPAIKTLAMIAALFHDWGKANLYFQNKLFGKNKHIGDPLRHEWMSCLLLYALVKISNDPHDDNAWLDLLIHKQWQEQDILTIITKLSDSVKDNFLADLPPIAQLVAWLIVSHHRLPYLSYIQNTQKPENTLLKEIIGISTQELSTILKRLKADWGYQNSNIDNPKELKQCLTFKQGLLQQSAAWVEQLSQKALALKQQQTLIQNALQNGCWRLILLYARLSLMLGDHYYSSCNYDEKWQSQIHLFANTLKHKREDRAFNQYLDEHLVHVCQYAGKIARTLSRFEQDMPVAPHIKQLKKKSPPAFAWQDQAVQKIKTELKKTPSALQNGWFIVNMASTGKGKTLANAKIMQALSPDGESLRYILALGLRTLTLQTGEAYRQNIGLDRDELAVLIGSKAIQELFAQQIQLQNAEPDLQDIGSESLEELLDGELEFNALSDQYVDFLKVLFPPNKSEKNKAFLYKPVLVCTIDHIIGATETRRGGKYILPCLRLLSSDLVIDEVDDFNPKDLVAIARLVHLAGMMGRKVMISSATIPPDLAEGLFNAYHKGWQLYCLFKHKQQTDIHTMWVDEFNSQINTITYNTSDTVAQQYQLQHTHFIEQRIQHLKQQPSKHKAYIIPCEHLKTAEKNLNHEQQNSLRQGYFQLIQENIEKLHQNHHIIDPQTQKRVSFGVVRMANIPPCVALTRYLLQAEWSSHISPKIMAYHSQQILLLRSEQEHHLDDVLNRKTTDDGIPRCLKNPIIRRHLTATSTQDVIFIVVATPVEEVGRDHDFDWAIIEPSSYRSIIQLTGRVWRHRDVIQHIEHPNVAIMQYNLKGLYGKSVAFTKPGFEMDHEHFLLASKNICDLIDSETLAQGINAIPRIQKPNQTDLLAHLEHRVTQFYLNNTEAVGVTSLNGWLNEAWFLTALPQQIFRFRESQNTLSLYAYPDGENILIYRRDNDGNYIPCQKVFFTFELITLSEIEKQRLWLERDYDKILDEYITQNDNLRRDTVDFDETISDSKRNQYAQRYGEITIPFKENDPSRKTMLYSHQFGFIEKE